MLRLSYKIDKNAANFSQKLGFIITESMQIIYTRICSLILYFSFKKLIDTFDKILASKL